MVNFFTLLTLFCFAQTVYAEVSFLGRYTNQSSSRSDDPHTEGYSLSLYRENELVFGKICQGTGIEIPCAPLRLVKLSEQGMLSFQARLRTGVLYTKETGSEGVPAAMLIQFEGKMGKDMVRGRLVETSIHLQRPNERSEEIKLRHTATKTAKVKSYEDWRRITSGQWADW